jgi:hypothetical protein
VSLSLQSRLFRPFFLPVLLVTALLIGLAAIPAHATYPDHLIRIVVTTFATMPQDAA